MQLIKKIYFLDSEIVENEYDPARPSAAYFSLVSLRISRPLPCKGIKLKIFIHKISFLLILIFSLNGHLQQTNYYGLHKICIYEFYLLINLYYFKSHLAGKRVEPKSVILYK